MRTDEMIARLAGDLVPVAPLPHPLRRGLAWLAGTTLFFTTLIAVRTVLADAPVSAVPWSLLAPQAAAVATSMAAAVAAFMMVVAGRSRAVLAWPMAAAAFWIGSLVLGSLREGAAQGLAAPADARLEWLCVAMIVMGSALPLLAMVRMLRGGAALAPRITIALSALSAAGLANVSACFSHPHTSSTVLLFWHVTTVALLVIVGAAAGRSLLAWPRPAVPR
jgi:hypothetical protein